MRINILISLFLLSLVMSGCSNTRFLTDEQVLYTGREKVEIVTDQARKEVTGVKNTGKFHNRSKSKQWTPRQAAVATHRIMDL